jgi:hypothetical protein
MTEHIEALVAEARADPESNFGSSPSAAARSPAHERISSLRCSNGWQRARQDLLGVTDDASVDSSREDAKQGSSNPAVHRVSPRRLHLGLETPVEANSHSPVRTNPVDAKGPSLEGRVRTLFLKRASAGSLLMEIDNDVAGLTPRSLQWEKIRALMPWNVAHFYFAQRREERAEEEAKRGRTRYRRRIFEAKQKHAGRFMADPKNRYRVAWDLCVVLPLLFYIVVSVPFRFVVRLKQPPRSYRCGRAKALWKHEHARAPVLSFSHNLLKWSALFNFYVFFDGRRTHLPTPSR